MDDQDVRDLGGISIDEQCDRLEKAFLHGWVYPARGPMIFSQDELARLDQVSEHGGWLNKEELEYLQRLRAGGRRGDPLPAAPACREPFINGIGEDFEARIAKTAEQVDVVVLFSHERWPGIRFGHRFSPPGQADGYAHLAQGRDRDRGSGSLDGSRPEPGQ